MSRPRSTYIGGLVPGGGDRLEEKNEANIAMHWRV